VNHRKENGKMKRFSAATVVVGLLVLPAGAAGVSGQDKENAARECRALKKAMGTENFRDEFGTNKNKRNAFGKCVSRKSREEARERRSAKRHAAKDCKAEQDDPNFAASHDGKSFGEFYGTNTNSKGKGKGRNAFGKCVSSKAKENKAEADEKDKQKINAAKACRAEQNDPDFTSTHDGKSFDEFYGTNENDENAFGKCVSGKARAKNG
jgi:hypothetical protein